LLNSSFPEVNTKAYKLLLLFVFCLISTLKAQDDQQSLLLAPAKSGGLWGFINPSGAWVIAPQYGEANNFHDNVAEVVQYTKDDIKNGFIDKNNNWVIQLPEFNFSHFSEGRLAFMENGLYGFMDSVGKKVIPAQFRYCSNFENGKAMVVFRSGKAGYINREKKLLISPRWDTAFNFQGNFAIAGKKTIEGKILYGVIDNTGNTLVPYQYSWITNFSEEKAFANQGGVLENGRINGGTWMIINMKEQAILPLKDTTLIVEIDNYNEAYSNLLKFRNDVAWFPGRVNGEILYGLINPSGKWVVRPSYKVVNKINEGLTAIFNNGRMGYIDLKGKEIIPCKFESAGAFNNNLAWFKEGKKYGFINKNGEVVIPPKFEDVRDFMLVK
jgi:hypothetical protein